jgi:hypothetical protein
MTTTALTSELEAINIILQAAEEAPVQSLALTGLYPLDKAKGILSEASAAVQSTGWKFNSEEDFSVSPDGAGQITLPANMLRFDVAPSNSYKAVQRGTRLYDAQSHSYVFSGAVKGTAVFLLSWDELPQPARYFVAIKAARTMQGRSSISESAYRYSLDDEQAARLALSEHETVTGDYNMLRDSWSCASVLQGREELFL